MTEERHAALALHPLTAAPGEPPLDLLSRRQVMRRTQVAGLVVLILLALGGGRTLFSRAANATALQATAAEQSRLYVKTVRGKRGGATATLSLPGTLQGSVQAPIAARSSGYLRRWTKDIGSRVAKGEVLAEIDSPEIDQQLGQAIAAREQASASLDLARSTLQRWEGLRKKDVISQQDLEEKRSGVTQGQANVAAAEANVQRLRQLAGFKRVVAPFAGVITRRNVDVGDLIDPSRVLFTLAQTDTLRVVVNVPQSASQMVKPGLAVTVTQAELRDQRFTGEVVRTSASIDPATRTLQAEVALPNREGRLLPGAYVQVALPLPASAALIVPTNALMFRAEGSLVAVVGAGGKVSLRKIGVGRNFGDTFEALGALTEQDRLVLNPSDGLIDGQVVEVAADKPAPAASGAAGAAPAAPAASRP
jgi:RND family efflux transporter MFP subunit